MKKLLAAFILVFSTLNLFPQDITKNSYGISVGTGQSGIFSLAKTDGGASHDALSTFEAGFNYYHPLNHTLYFESGLYFHYNKIKITPGFYPDMDLTPRYYNLNLLYIPLNLKKMLSKYFFIHGGLLFNVDISNNSAISNQTGIGTDFGFGLELPVFKHYSISINPYLNINGLYRFKRTGLSESLLGDGIRITFKN